MKDLSKYRYGSLNFNNHLLSTRNHQPASKQEDVDIVTRSTDGVVDKREKQPNTGKQKTIYHPYLLKKVLLSKASVYLPVYNDCHLPSWYQDLQATSSSTLHPTGFPVPSQLYPQSSSPTRLVPSSILPPLPI